MPVVIHSFPVWLPLTQTWMYNQVRYLPKTIENHIVCEFTENLEQFRLPRIYALREASSLRYYWDSALRKLRIRRHLGFLVSMGKKVGANIVHSHFGNVGWRDLGAVQRLGARQVVTFYGLDVNMLPTQDSRWRERYQNLFDKAALFHCQGLHMAQCLSKMGCPEEKVKIHHLGVEVEHISYRARKWNPGEPLRVLIAASFREKKGIPYALSALGILQEHVHLEITVIGDATRDERSQSEKCKIMMVLDRCGLQPRTRFLGYVAQQELWDQAYRHHIFVSPSITSEDGDTEGGAPIAIIEMMASGMPVVSTFHCDIPEVILHGSTGWLTPERNVEDLVRVLRWWVSHPEKWREMIEKGRQHVEREYNAAVQGQKLGEIYANLI